MFKPVLRRCATPLFAATTAAALAACGSAASTSTPSPSAPASVSTPTHTSSTTPVVTTTTTTVATATSAASAAAAAVAPGCIAPHTAVTIGGGGGGGGAGLGHLDVVLLFRNSGSAPCTLTGYPGLALVAATGRHRELQIARTPNGYLGGLADSDRVNPIVRLGPGKTASAMLEGDASNPGGGSCPSYGAMLVTPPNQRVTVHFAHGVALCDPEVHPVVAGLTGRQG